MNETEQNSECFHRQFAVDASMELDAPGGTGYVLDLSVICAQCNRPFVFDGLPRGINNAEPVSGVTGAKARLPMRPIAFSDIENLSAAGVTELLSAFARTINGDHNG